MRLSLPLKHVFFLLHLPIYGQVSYHNLLNFTFILSCAFSYFSCSLVAKMFAICFCKQAMGSVFSLWGEVIILDSFDVTGKLFSVSSSSEKSLH